MVQRKYIYLLAKNVDSGCFWTAWGQRAARFCWHAPLIPHLGLMSQAPVTSEGHFPRCTCCCHLLCKGCKSHLPRRAGGEKREERPLAFSLQSAGIPPFFMTCRLNRRRGQKIEKEFTLLNSKGKWSQSIY